MEPIHDIASSSESTIGVGEQCFYACGARATKYFSCPNCSGPGKTRDPAKHSNRYMLCEHCLRHEACRYCEYQATSQDASDDSDLSVALVSVETSPEETCRTPLLIIDWLRGNLENVPARTRSLTALFCSNLLASAQVGGKEIVFVGPDLVSNAVSNMFLGSYVYHNYERSYEELHDAGISWLLFDLNAERLPTIIEALNHHFRVCLIADELFELQDDDLSPDLKEFCMKLNGRWPQVAFAVVVGPKCLPVAANAKVLKLRIALWQSARFAVESGLRILCDAEETSQLPCTDGMWLRLPSSIETDRTIAILEALGEQQELQRQDLQQNMMQSVSTNRRKLCMGLTRGCHQKRAIRFQCNHCVVCKRCVEVLSSCPVCGSLIDSCETLLPDSVGTTDPSTQQAASLPRSLHQCNSCTTTVSDKSSQ